MLFKVFMNAVSSGKWVSPSKSVENTQQCLQAGEGEKEHVSQGSLAVSTLGGVQGWTECDFE